MHLRKHVNRNFLEQKMYISHLMPTHTDTPSDSPSLTQKRSAFARLIKPIEVIIVFLFDVWYYAPLNLYQGRVNNVS